MNYFRYFIYISLVGILLIAGVCFIKINEGLRYIVNTKVSEALGVKVSVDEIDLKLLKGEVEISGLKIANPAGFSSNYSAFVPKIAVKFNVKELMHSPVLIDEVNLYNPVVRLELNKAGNNLSSLHKNTLESASRNASNKAPKSNAGKTVAIKLITINNIDLHADLGFISKDVKLSNVAIDGVKDGVAIPYKALIANVLENIISQALNNPEFGAQIFSGLNVTKSPKEIRNEVKSIVAGHLKGQLSKLFK